MTDSLEKPTSIIIPISETQAIVLESGADGVTPTAVGQKLTTSEVNRLASALKATSDAYIVAKQATGHLVELDPLSREMLQTAKTITESGGWIQANLRNSANHFTRVMRIRPVTGVALLNPAAAVLGSVAAQAQAAEMAQDIKAILGRVTQLQRSFANDRHGQVISVVNEISHHVRIAREHSETDVSDAAIAGLRLKASHLLEASLQDLTDAVREMTSTKRRLPSGARKDLDDESLSRVQTALDHGTLLFASSAQLYALETSRLMSQGKPQVAQTHLDELAEWRDQTGGRLTDQLDALTAFDERTRALAKPFWRRALFIPTAAPGAAAGIIPAARTLPLVASRAAPWVSAIGAVVGSAHAGREHFAQQTVTRQLNVLDLAGEDSHGSMQNVLHNISALDASTRAITSEAVVSDRSETD